VSDVNIKILILEDDESARVTLKEVLSLEGYSVDEAKDAPAALELLKDNTYDILLVDYRLPGMNGIDFIRQAMTFSNDSIPIIVTGVASLENAVESMRIGAHDYLVKPVNVEELKKILLNVIVERDEFRKGKDRFLQMARGLERDNPDGLIPIVKTGKARKGRGLFGTVWHFLWGA
jgi:DNA-binding response OmpR family regulator